jgi:prepilin-type processing-associated H-X9-DG protein
VELLVVIAIIGILVALLLPAVQAAREAARRTQCVNNLKQQGLAVHNYHDTFKCIPPMEVFSWELWGASARPGHVAKTTWGAMTLLLPFVEQTALHETLNPDGWQLPTPETQPLQLEPLEVYSCPSDAGGDVNPYFNNAGKANYFPSQGTFWVGYHNPPFDEPAEFRNIADGLSNTVLIGERFLDSDGGPWKSPAGVWIGRTGGSNSQVHGRGAFPPNTPYPGPAGEAPNGATDPLGKRTAWTSLHPGGVNVVFADGSVHFISENIDSLTSYPHSRYTNFYRMDEVYTQAEMNRVWQNLFRPSDGNSIGQY